MINIHVLDRMAMFGMGFLYGWIVFKLLPLMWRDFKDDMEELLLTKEKHSPEDTDEHLENNSIHKYSIGWKELQKREEGK